MGIGWLFCVVGLGFGMGFFGEEYATYGILAGQDPTAAEFMAWVPNWSCVPLAGLMFVFVVPIFHDGRGDLSPLESRRLGRRGRHGYGDARGQLGRGPIDNFQAVENPVGVEGGAPAVAGSLGFLVVLRAMATSADVRAAVRWGDSHQLLPMVRLGCDQPAGPTTTALRGPT